MSSAQEGSRGRSRDWIWDSREQQWYYYNPGDDTLVYEDGRRMTRPNHVTVPSLHAAAVQMRALQDARYQQGSSLDARMRNLSVSNATSPLDRKRPLADPATANNPASQPAVGNVVPVNYPSAPLLPQTSLPGPVDGHVRKDPATGARIVTARDPTNGVQLTLGTKPAFTDPTYRKEGIHAHRVVYGEGREGDTERLYSTFRVRNHKFFVVGRVFVILWVEPAGETGTLITSLEPNDRQEPGMAIGKLGQHVFSKVRRFVVVREAHNYCSALPIMTYGKQGVGKEGVNKSEHGIIHTGDNPPDIRAFEKAKKGEGPLRPRPIRVVPDEPMDKLDSMSRIDFGKVHTIQHNIKVRPFGNVHPNSMDALQSQFANVWHGDSRPGPSSSGGYAAAKAAAAVQRAANDTATPRSHLTNHNYNVSATRATNTAMRLTPQPTLSPLTSNQAGKRAMKPEQFESSTDSEREE